MFWKDLKSWWVALIIFTIISIIFCWPIFHNFSNIGFMDGDWYVFINSVFEKTVKEFHQVPLWNPYYFGGNVAIANQEFPFISLTTIIVSVIAFLKRTIGTNQFGFGGSPGS